MTSLDEIEKLKIYYEEQLASQRGMLTSAIDSLVAKRGELEEALKVVSQRNFELAQISHRTFHDMKEPMVSLLGLVRIIREESNSESVRYLVNLAEASVKRLNNFSVSLSNYVEVVQKKPEIREFNFEEMLDSVLDGLKYSEGFDKVRFEVVNVSDQTLVNHDWDVLATMIKQPIVNAIRYRDVDKCPLVSLMYKIKSGRMLLCVKDNGIGMSPAVHSKVTSMFYRGSNKSTGVGLGLYMTKNLLEKYGGNYRISSIEGVGTSVNMILNLNH